MHIKYKIVFFLLFPITASALDEKECSIEFENNSSSVITNQDSMNYCFSRLENKQVENIVVYGSTTTKGTLTKNKKLAIDRAKKSISLLKKRYPDVPVKELNPYQMKSMGTKAIVMFYYKEPAENKNIAFLETKISEMDMEIKNKDALLAAADGEIEKLKKKDIDYNYQTQQKNQQAINSYADPNFRIGSLFTYDTYYRESGINYLSLGSEFTWLIKSEHFRPEIGAKIKTSIPNLKLSDNNIQVTNTYAIFGLGMTAQAFSAGLRVIGGKEWIKVPERNINKSDLAAGGEARIGFELEKGPSIFLTYSLTNNLQMIGLDVGLSF